MTSLTGPSPSSAKPSSPSVPMRKVPPDTRTMPLSDVSLLRFVFCLRVFLFLDETGLLAPQQGEAIAILLRILGCVNTGLYKMIRCDAQAVK